VLGFGKGPIRTFAPLLHHARDYLSHVPLVGSGIENGNCQ
jgi:hypothetical protein